ncbi:hypothetical protein [Amycolatopsis sp. WGS_07]|uniref:hypothetical protein n=1 Tax=Amycolatopsis sp. WGS_07 TaxID=3076764 RepID=UPI003873BFAC
MENFPEADAAIAAATELPDSDQDQIEDDFADVSPRWGCAEIIVLDAADARALLRAVLSSDAAEGFSRSSVTTSAFDVQLTTHGAETFRPYRIVKREDGQFSLYGHASLYRARDASGGDSSALTEQLIAIGRAEGVLLAERGSELRERVKSIGSALNKAGGAPLMLRAHATVRQALGPGLAQELEVSWDGVGGWLG